MEKWMRIMGVDDTDAPNFTDPSGNAVTPTEGAKPGVSAESVGAMIGAVVGVVAVKLLTTPKGERVNVAEGLKKGTKTAGAMMVGGMLAGGSVGTAFGLLNGVNAAARDESHGADLQGDSDNRDELARREAVERTFALRIAADEEELAPFENLPSQGI